jgi:hypothetical protein
MLPKKLWPISFILLLVHFVLQYFFFESRSLTDNSAWLFILVDLLSTLVIIFLLGAGLGLIFALIPYKNRTFKENFSMLFPLFTVIVIVVLISMIIYAIYMRNIKGIELSPL